MHDYSPYFQTIHDEPAPYGSLGRGTHYSVFRAAVWHNQDLTPHKESALILTFAVIWDEDHDERVIGAAEQLYLQGILPAALFIGERKGSFTFLTPKDCALSLVTSKWKKLQDDVFEIAQGGADGDSWPGEVHQYTAREHHIIQDDYSKTQVYLENIKQLWNLGMSRPAAGIPPTALPTERITPTVRQKYALT